MTTPSARRKRPRGGVDRLPSGAFRVRVYAGQDPVTKRRHYLTEIVPAGPRAATLAEQSLTRLLNQVDERRNPRTVSTVNQLLDRHLELLDIERSTLLNYRSQLALHVRPFIGGEKVGAIDGAVLDSLYAELRRCRTGRAPHGQAARLRCALRAACVPATVGVEHPADPPHPVGGVQASRALALGGNQPDVTGGAAASASAQSAASVGHRCGEDLERGVASGSRLGGADLACHDHRCPPR